MPNECLPCLSVSWKLVLMVCVFNCPSCSHMVSTKKLGEAKEKPKSMHEKMTDLYEDDVQAANIYILGLRGELAVHTMCKS